MDNPPPEKISFKSIQVFDENIGIGAYGSVHKALCDDLLCAAKRIHGVLVETAGSLPNAGGHRVPIQRFKLEFRLLQQLRHPNIIQYLGMYDDPNTQLPVLLMELMDESLTNYLESSTQPIPYHTQVNICLDITRALSHLHINGIVHRDLSSNNILLCGKPCRAKLSDFGMAKFLNAKATLSRVSDTSVPGTDRYMPPEAFDTEDYFKEKGDVFSFGVVIVQILTRKFPNPSARFRDVVIANDSRRLKECLSENERRENHLQLVQQDHPLLPIALECLNDSESNRPDASNLCNGLATLTSGAPYLESKEAEERPVKSMEDKSVATECTVENKSCGTVYDLECEYVFLAPDSASVERMQHLEQALSEEKDVVFSKTAEVKALKDQLETKQAVADKLIETNDRLLSHKEQLKKQLDEKEKLLENLSQEKENLIRSRNEMEAKLKKQLQESSDLASKQQQQLKEKEEQLTDQCTTISEQCQAIKEHVELQDQQKKQLNEQTKHIAQQQERIDDLVAEVSSLATSSKKKKNRKQSKAPKKPPAPVEPSANGAQPNQAQGGGGFRSFFKPKQSQAQPKGNAQSKQEGQIKSDVGTNRDKQIHSDVPSLSNAPTPDINSLEKPPYIPSSSDPTQPITRSLAQREAVARAKIETSTKKSIVLLKDIQQKTHVTTEVPQQGYDIDRQPQKMDRHVGKEQHGETKPDPVPIASPSPRPEPQVQETKQTTPSSGFFSRFFSKKETEQVSPPPTTEKPSSKQPPSKKVNVDCEDKVTPVRATSKWNNPFDGDTSALTSKRQTQQQSQELRERDQRAIREMEASSARCLHTATDAYRIGVDTIVELERQSEGLDRIEARLDETHDAVSERKTVYSKSDKTQSKKRGVMKHPPDPAPNPRAHQMSSVSAMSQLPSTGSDVVDRNLEELSGVLQTMKSVGVAMGSALDQQNDQVGRIQEKSKRNKGSMAAFDREIKRHL